MNTYRAPLALWFVAGSSIVLAIVASLADWPAQFMANGQSPEGTIQWIVRGSAISAPVTLIALFALAGFAATRVGTIGKVADYLAILLALAMLIGGVSEAVVENKIDLPLVVTWGSAALSAGLAALVIASVIHDLALRQQTTSSHADSTAARHASL